MEDEGLATVLIALVRRQAEEVKPPRALWVPFPLGRPFGAAGNAPFQRRILMALLDLFARPAGPVLEDFTDEAPPEGANRDVIDHLVVNRNGPLLDEVDGLRAWYEASVARRGRTTLGGSGTDATGAARLLTAWLNDEATAEGTEVDQLRLASEDLKAYYMESAVARTGAADTGAVTNWFWTRTAAGRTIREVRSKCLSSNDAALRDAGSYMFVPEYVNG